MRHTFALASLLLCLHASVHAAAPPPGEVAVRTASYAVATYRTAVIDSLAKMVAFNTVADKEHDVLSNPQHIGFKRYLKAEAEKMGFDFTDHGAVVVIGLGSGSERIGVITHGDIQPVDPGKWKKSPFELDATSEPGRLIGRGTEDDKGPIATALYAMKAIKDNKVALSKRIELYVYMAEESDWAPLTAFLKTHQAPQINITLDAEYPVVTAEKGYGTVSLTVPAQARTGEAAQAADTPVLSAFTGGFFGSQIPEDASAVIENATPALEAQINARASTQANTRYRTSWQGKQLTIKAMGVSAHSSKPEDGSNAISMLADALSVQTWPNTTAGALVNFLNTMIGTGYEGKQFGRIAYSDKFMGPMTFAPTVLKQTAAGIELHINLRRPQGKTGAQLRQEIDAALAEWQERNLKLEGIKIEIGEPWLQTGAPQVPVLLSVFSYFTGVKNPKPVSIGGGTNSRLFPNAVSFGPSMPGTVYSGHSEHEFITTKQLLLNLQMYTAVLVELGK